MPRERAGIGSGMIATSQQFAQAAGAAVLGAVFFAVVHADAGHDTAMERVLYLDLGLLAVVAGLVVHLHRHVTRTASGPRRPVRSGPGGA